jgi:hypothetical protein
MLSNEYGTCKPRHKVFLCDLVVCLYDRLDVRLPGGEREVKIRLYVGTLYKPNNDPAYTTLLKSLASFI